MLGDENNVKQNGEQTQTEFSWIAEKWPPIIWKKWREIDVQPTDEPLP